MAIENNINFQKGDTVTVKSLTYVWNNNTKIYDASDMDSNYPKVTITDPSGVVKVSAASMTKVATGDYQYNYNTDSTLDSGWWSVKILSTKSGVSSVEYSGFMLN